jgi:hypothetical protein
MSMLKSYFNRTIIVTIFFTIIICPLLSALADDNHQQLAFGDQTTMIKDQFNNNSNSKPANGSSGNTTPKVVILNFYDDDKSQFTNAKPILYLYTLSSFLKCRPDWIALWWLGQLLSINYRYSITTLLALDRRRVVCYLQ